MHTKVLTWENRAPQSLSRYGIALLSVTLASVLTLVLRRLGYPDNFGLFYGAVLASVWLGGFFPSLLATALSVSASIIIFQPNFGTSGLGPYNSGRFIVFVLISLVVSFLGAARDRSEAASRASEQHYQLLFDRNLAGVFLSTLDGRILDCNESFARILGYDSPKDVMTHPASDFYFDPANRESFIEKMKNEGSLTGLEECIKGKDGRTVWIIVNVSLGDDDAGSRTLLQGTIIDITVRKRTEEALREAERNYRDIFDHAVEGIFRTSPDGRFITANPALATMLGYDSPAGLLSDRSDLAQQLYVDPLRREEFKRQMDEQGMVRAFEFEVKRIDGKTIWISDNVRAVLDDNGDVLYYEGSAEDITERKRAEEALRLSEQRYRLIVETSGEGIWQIDAESRTTFVNHRMAEMLGYTVAKMQGASMFEFMDEEGKTIALMNIERRRSGIKEVHDFKFRRKDCSDLWAIVSAAPIFDSAGKYDGALRLITDITERRRVAESLRESEERYRELFENAHDAIYVHDLKGNYVSVNRAAEKLSGYSRAEIIGRNAAEFIAPEHLKEIRACTREKIAGKEQSAYEIEIITKDGDRVHVEVDSRLIFENGIAVGVQGMARDISDRKRADEAMRTLPRRLIGAQEAERRRVARELHDEIGQALTAIRINLQSLQQSSSEEELATHLDGSISIVDRALQQVRDLALDLRPSLLDDLGLNAALRWYLDRETTRAGLTLELSLNLKGTRLAPEIETTCFRIVQEALTNILRHAHAKKVSVELSLRDSGLRLLIRDDGVGFNVDATLHRFKIAASLGLQGMQERAVAVGGKLEIMSKKANGTEVRVQLPFQPILLSQEES